MGNTLLVEIDGVLVKLEYLNPTGSVKDRFVKRVMAKAIADGLIKKGEVVIEMSTGNTAISFAAVCAWLGLKFIAIMPKSASKERIELVRAYGGEVILVDGNDGDEIRNAWKCYKDFKNRNSAFYPSQFSNSENPKAYMDFGEEIWRQTNGKVDVFVAGVGTGGTIIGTARFLKKKHPNIKAFGVEPKESAVLCGQNPGRHLIEGIGEGFVPPLVKEDFHLIDGIIQISSQEAIEETIKLWRKGFFVGISSGANLLAAKQLRKEYKHVVTLFPDQGNRYLSVINRFLRDRALLQSSASQEQCF